jgi:hypothetical protein
MRRVLMAAGGGGGAAIVVVIASSLTAEKVTRRIAKVIPKKFFGSLLRG